MSHRLSIVLVWAALPLACAVGTSPELRDDEEPSASSAGRGGSGAGKAGLPLAGSSAFGGSAASAGSPGTSGASSSGAGGKAGSSATGGKGGSLAQAGASAAGASSGGASGAGAGGGAPNGCGALKSWKGGDSTLQIAAGEVIQWQGKRYKALAAIAYPNAECAPDAPVAWCADWFMPDGGC